MKRLWTAAAFALLACAGLVTPTQADGSFGLFYCGRHCNQCAVCIRPYNAFTPVLCGDVCGYNCGGCNGPGGCGQGGCSPIGCPCGYGCGYGCGQGGCGFGCGKGGCGYGGCGQGGYGYGWNQANHWDPRLRMMNLGGPGDPAYTGALGYNPPDGMGNGAFGTVGLGRLSVFGMPACGGCGACAACRNYYGPMNTFNPAPMACGPQGCAPAYGFGMDFGTPTFATSAETKPALVPVPTKPEAKQSPQAQSTYGYPTQPVSYMPTYPVAGQQMPYYGYTQPAWGYGYQAPSYPAWGYQGW